MRAPRCDLLGWGRGRWSIRSDGWTNPVPDSPASPRESSTECARYIERFSCFQDVITGTRQFVCDRLDGNDGQGFRCLLLIPAFDLGVVAHGKVGGLDKGPGQVFVATLGIAFAFLLAIGFMPAVDGAGIRGEVAGPGEAGDVSRFQRNRQCQDVAKCR